MKFTGRNKVVTARQQAGRRTASKVQKQRRQTRSWSARNGEVITYSIGDDKPTLPPGRG